MIPKELKKLLWQKPLDTDQYYQEEHLKSQVILHHTGSGVGVSGDFLHWSKDKIKVATPFIIERDGKICQLFSSKYWAFALGISSYSNNIHRDLKQYYQAREQHSVQIELDSWGVLVEKNGGFYSLFGKKIPTKDVIKYPTTLGTRHSGLPFERYTSTQINSLKIMLLYLRDTYNIPLDYKEDMWNISNRALKGEPGVWTHSTFVTANLRNDIHPQPELIEMLKSLC